MESGAIAVRDIELRFWSGLTAPPVGTDSVIYVHKDRDFVDRLAAVIKRCNPRRMLEVGLQDGGSVIYWHHALNLERMIGVDRVAAIPHLTNYIERHGLGNVVRPHLGLSQDNASVLRQIVQEECGGELDVVVDDASHMHSETRATLEILLPFVRPGGAYIIEDWAWGHGDKWPPAMWAELPLMSPILTEAYLVTAFAPGVLSRVEIERNFAVLWRGDAQLPQAESFRLADNYQARGLPVGI
jgi:hypothetical protein